MSTIRSSSTSRVRHLQSSSVYPVPSGSTQHYLFPRTQTRNATYIPRPKRPYTFTQLIALSDGSTFLHRTTSPTPVYRSTRDTRNTPMWNPSNARMANIEEDEAGRLRAFRRKFGRGFDSREREPAPAQVEDAPEGFAPQAPVATQEDDGVVKEVIRKDAGKGAKSEDRRQAGIRTEPDAESQEALGGVASPAPAAAKTQKEAQPDGQGSATTGGWGEDYGEGDNLMDLISSYGTENQAKMQKQQQGQTISKPVVSKKK